MKSIVFSLPGNELLTEKIIQKTHFEKGDFILHHFPDGETDVRIISPIENKKVYIICTLQNPNEKILPLFFLCKLAKDLKASSVCLIAPYLAYMRQDKLFNPGEAITSTYFATLISSFCDQLITLDPHLHRLSALDKIYSIPSLVLHASSLISNWIQAHVSNAILIGPDSESEQWLSQVAQKAGVPFLLLNKIRYGDHEVEISKVHAEKYMHHTPVLIDDIISTAHTMMETIKYLKQDGMKPAVCIGVHAIFAENAYADLMHSGVQKVVTTNSIMHESNQIDISDLIAAVLENNAA